MRLVQADEMRPVGTWRPVTAAVEEADASDLLSWQRQAEQLILALGEFLGAARGSAERGLDAMARFAGLVDAAAQASTTRLGGALTALPGFARADAAERKLVQALQVDLAGAQRSVHELASRMSTLAQLALLARMETAALGDQAAGFEGFTSEVDGLVDRAEQTVVALDGEIGKLLLGVAGLQRLDLRGAAGTVHETVHRIGTLLEQATERRTQGRAAMQAVGERLEELRRDTARLVMGLQFHDAMRQRLEHVAFGLERLRMVRTRSVLGDDDPGTLDDGQKKLAIGALTALQAAQLRDLGQLVEQECANAAQALVGMGRSVAAAQDLFRSAWGNDATDVMAELDNAISGIAATVEGYAQARIAMTEARERALLGIERMSGFAADLDEVESAIRMAGLNATFRSAQLGGVGGPMKCIAQELRASAGQIGQAVTAFSGELAAIGAAVDRLRDHAGADRSEDRSGLVTDLLDGVAVMHRMDRDGTELRDLVGQTLAGLAESFVAHARELSAIGGPADMRSLAGRIEMIGSREGTDPAGCVLWPALDRLLQGTYTTRDERNVHQSLHGTCQPETRPAPPAPQEIDDILF